MTILKLDKEGIYEYQQNREPYLMIDQATEIVPGVSSKGYKDFKIDEWFFKVHWPGDPNMPGMLQVESMIQMSSLIILTLPKMSGKTLYLADSDNIKFFKKIVPGDKLKIVSKLLSKKRGLFKFESKGFVAKKIVCKANFTLILPGMSIIIPNN